MLLAAFAQLILTPFAFAGEIDFSFTADKAEVRQGEELTYSVSVHNCDARAANNILVADSMPKGTTLISCSAADYTLSNRNLLVGISHLPVGEVFSFGVTVRIDRRGSFVKTLLLRENGATLKTLQHKISVLSNNVLTSKVNMFTPNGDGMNDYFEIPGLLDYPNNELVVFNRYSDKVYQKRNYANDWDGSNLPAGSYYYLLTIYLDNSVAQKYNGFVSIKRQP
ncbi:MAG: gliding motility-associated C-terminal domain-containing protein [Prevotellaceae bacterium]|jgi:gliding motility-associated-like protein/uncharacterized repeat protein (TIGR01451 family)|nr:gliding motility-associated C-terminal domain-containing protein [Prevotellaceae bacterium]